jgi:pimeloyl-ACP methyl ester carboxylesterase
MAQIAYELHTALANAREKGPYVLVGASLGGAMVRVFAANYPNDTAGMVLINATAGDGFIIVGGRPIRLRETSLKRKIPPVQAVFKPDPGASEPLVIRRTKSNTFVAVSPRSKLPPELQRIWLIARKQPKYSAAASSEFEFLPEEMDLLFAAAGANPHPLGSKPLVVLASDVAYDRAQGGMSAADLESDRKRLQAKLAALSTKGRLMIVKDCGTEIHLEQPEAVVSAIRDVAGMAKSAPKINDATTELKTARR